MRCGSLFSGIGGFDLAAEWMGWENIFHCEWNEFGQKILKHYWSNAISYGDITKTDFTIHRGQINILTGGFPCQPYSLAGKRKGKEDERHLWPEMLRAIREIQPCWVVGENVPGIINWSGGLVFHEVQTDLETEGYEVFTFVLPACGVNAPHKRERVWFVAHSTNSGIKRMSGWENAILSSAIITNTNRTSAKNEIQTGRDLLNCKTSSNTPRNRINRINRDDNQQEESDRDRNDEFNSNSQFAPDSGNQGLQGSQNGREFRSIRKGEKQQSDGSLCTTWEIFPTQSPFCSRDDGISSQLDGITFPKWRNESIKAYGNAIVPQVVYQIFKAIEDYEKLGRTS